MYVQDSIALEKKCCKASMAALPVSRYRSVYVLTSSPRRKAQPFSLASVTFRYSVGSQQRLRHLAECTSLIQATPQSTIAVIQKVAKDLNALAQNGRKSRHNVFLWFYRGNLHKMFRERSWLILDFCSGPLWNFSSFLVVVVEVMVIFSLFVFVWLIFF